MGKVPRHVHGQVHSSAGSCSRGSRRVGGSRDRSPLHHDHVKPQGPSLTAIKIGGSSPPRTAVAASRNCRRHRTPKGVGAAISLSRRALRSLDKQRMMIYSCTHLFPRQRSGLLHYCCHTKFPPDSIAARTQSVRPRIEVHHSVVFFGHSCRHYTKYIP